MSDTRTRYVFEIDPIAFIDGIPQRPTVRKRALQGATLDDGTYEWTFDNCGFLCQFSQKGQFRITFEYEDRVNLVETATMRFVWHNRFVYWGRIRDGCAHGSWYFGYYENSHVYFDSIFVRGDLHGACNGAYYWCSTEVPREVFLSRLPRVGDLRGVSRVVAQHVCKFV